MITTQNTGLIQARYQLTAREYGWREKMLCFSVFKYNYAMYCFGVTYKGNGILPQFKGKYLFFTPCYDNGYRICYLICLLRLFYLIDWLYWLFAIIVFLPSNGMY